MKALILVLFMGMPLFGQIPSMAITGTVTNSSGDHIAGVKVLSPIYGHYVLTDTDGCYEIEGTFRPGQNTIRFSHPEYNAVIKIVSNNKIDVVLQKTTKASDNKRITPLCSGNDNLVGWKYKVKITSGANDFKEVTDTDYEMINIPASNNKEGRLMFLRGLNASSSIPEWPFLEEPNAILYDKDIEYENQRKDERGIPVDSPVDVKTQSDGKFWRFVGDSFNVISYFNVSEEIAREFDDILESLCVTR